MESSTGSSEDSSLFGLQDILLFITKHTDRNGLIGSISDTPGDHETSVEALHSSLDDGNIRPNANGVIRYPFYHFLFIAIFIYIYIYI